MFGRGSQKNKFYEFFLHKGLPGKMIESQEGEDGCAGSLGLFL